MWLDLYAGPGGIDTALQGLGIDDVVGIEQDDAACATRAAAGHATVQGDVSAVDPSQFEEVDGLAGGPPCPPFSNAGPGGGLRDMDRLLASVERCRSGWVDDALAGPWEDPRTAHVLQPLRYAHTLMPKFVMLEQVPGVLPVWRAVADVLSGWGYAADAYVLNAADFGVPQTRRRALMVASRGRRVARPEPTHSRTPNLFGADRWITMAEALGWGDEMRGFVVDRRQDGAPVVDPWTQPSPTVTATAVSSGVWRLRPRTSVVQGPRCSYVPGQDYSDSRALTVEEAATLQSFPAGYPWQGSAAKQGEQVGNAVPPLLAAHVLSALTGLPLSTSKYTETQP